MSTYKSYFSFVPIFELSAISDVDFGGFLVDKFINSQIDSVYGNGNPNSINSPNDLPFNIPSVSQPGVPIWDNISFSEAMIVCANRGRGWHLMTPFEQSSLSYLAKQYNIQPSGNNGGTSNPPTNISNSSELAKYDGEVDGRALPGTGTLKWAQSKIYDLSGLSREWSAMLMGSVNHSSPGTLYLPTTNSIDYLTSPFGRGSYKTNADTNIERVYLTTTSLSGISVGDSIKDSTEAATGTILSIDDINNYIYVRVLTDTFGDKSTISDTTAGATLTIDGAAGTSLTGIDSLVSIICDESTSTVWNKSWTVNEFVGDYLYVAESTISGELCEVFANTTSEIIIDPTSNMISEFTLDDNITFYVFEEILASNITDNFSSGTWYSIDELNTNSTLGASSIILESTDDESSYTGKQRFDYNITPNGTSTGEYLAGELSGCYSDGANSGVFMKLFESTPDYYSTKTGFRACKTL